MYVTFGNKNFFKKYSIVTASKVNKTLAANSKK